MDDNNNGQIDEGCGEICGNGVDDDDGDGLDVVCPLFQNISNYLYEFHSFLNHLVFLLSFKWIQDFVLFCFLISLLRLQLFMQNMQNHDNKMEKKIKKLNFG